MNRLNKLSGIIAIFIVLFLSQTTFAQRQHHGHKNPEQKLEKMTTELDLTDAQQSKIKEIMEEGKAEAMSLKKQKLAKEAQKEAMRNLMKEQKEAIKNVLTDEQVAKAKELKKAKKAKIKATRAEVKAYKEKNMIPVLKVQRAKLDSKISQADKKTIAEIQEKLEVNKAAMQAFKKSDKKKADLSEAEQQKIQTLRATRRVEMKKAAEIGKKYEAEITALMKEIAPQQEQWKKDIKEIKQKNTDGKGRKLQKAKKEKKDKKGKAQKPKKDNQKGKQQQRGQKGAMFILMK